MTTTGWKRLWRRPRRASGGGLFDQPTARQRYLVEQSRARYHRRPDAYDPGQEPILQGQLGTIENFRFVTCQMPDTDADYLEQFTVTRLRDGPDGLPVLSIRNWIDQPYQRVLRDVERTVLGAYAIYLGADLGAPDVTTSTNWWPSVLTTDEAIALVVDWHLSPIGPGYRVRSPAPGVAWMAIDELWGMS